MSSPDRRAVLCLLALAGCGFAPAYGPDGVAQGIRGTIRAAEPTDKNGFDLVEQLEDRLGVPTSDRFDLTYVIVTEAVGVGVTQTNVISRYNLLGSIDWALIDRASATRVAGGTVQSFTSWSATGSTVAGLTAEQDAAWRLMRILADQIVARLIAISGSWAQ